MNASDAVPASPFMRKRTPRPAPVTATSTALFRLGEVCNNHCPMCSNSGRPEGWITAQGELLRRVDRLKAWGFSRVVVTGGEPTVHPAFWAVVAKLQNVGIAWDINTHGRSFADPEFTEKALAHGLERAIVSFHSHVEAASTLISGMPERGHRQTVDGIANLVRAGCDVMLNLVVGRHNVEHLVAWVQYCAATFGHDAAHPLQLKVCFPYHGGKGGAWDGIDVTYSEVMPHVLLARQKARDLGLIMRFEAFPSCLLGEADNRNLSRTGFGETHYLEDLEGDRYFSMRAIERALAVYGPQCRSCTALPGCPGVGEGYAVRHGTDELTPFVEGRVAV